jgi:hypothetical protein
MKKYFKLTRRKKWMKGSGDFSIKPEHDNKDVLLMYFFSHQLFVKNYSHFSK